MTLSATALVTLIQTKSHLRKDASISEVVSAEYVGEGDGAETHFTLDHTPVTGSLKLYLNNSLLTETTHYSISGAAITFVVYPTSGYPITASYEYAPSSDTFEDYDDDLIEILINAATKKCEDYCKRAFIQRSITENRIGDGGTLLMLNKRPVNTFTSITLDGTALTEDEDFTLYKEEGYLERPIGTTSFWSDRIQAVSWTKGAKIIVTYNAGYAATMAATQALVPEAVLAVLVAVSNWYENRLGVTSQNISGLGSATYDVGELPEASKRLLSSLNTNLGVI